MKVHIIAIAGKASSAMAKMFKDLGWDVVGSDQNVYPPASDFLAELGVEVRTPYNADNLDEDVDLVMVAGDVLGVNPNHPEFLKAKSLGKKILSYPQVLEEFAVREKSIVVVGNYGKGTISGAIVVALQKLGIEPSYMVGAQMVDLENNVNVTQGDWSVFEGDEYYAQPVSGEPPISKFFYYHPKYLVLTSAEWDHYNFFKTEDAYIENYRKIIQQLPPDGILVANLDGKNVQNLLHDAPCRVITYSYDRTDADFCATHIPFGAKLFGQFNLSNLTAAYAMLVSLGFDPTKTLEALNQYNGLVYRLQIVHTSPEITVIRDLAHSPVKAEAALQAVRETWPDRHVVGVFEAFASSLKTRDILKELPGRFDAADEILVPKVDQIARIAKENRVTGKEITQAIGEKAVYLPKDELLLEHLLNIPQPAVVIFMSSGGIRGIPEKYIASLKGKNV